MRREMLARALAHEDDGELHRVTVVACDKCGREATEELAESKGWSLEDSDLCERCKPVAKGKVLK